MTRLIAALHFARAGRPLQAIGWVAATLGLRRAWDAAFLLAARII